MHVVTPHLNMYGVGYCGNLPCRNWREKAKIVKVCSWLQLIPGKYYRDQTIISEVLKW